MSTDIINLGDYSSLYAFPTLSSIAIKLVILWVASRQWQQLSNWVKGILLLFLGMNFAELSMFWYLSSPNEAWFPLAVYYSFLVAGLLAMTGYSLSLTQFASSFISRWIVGYSILVTVFLLIPGAALDGSKSTGVSISRDPGVLYPIVALTIFICAMAIWGLLVHTIGTTKDYLLRKRTRIILISVTPFLLVITGAIVATSIGLPYNAAVIGSIAMNFMWIVIVFTNKETHLFKLMSMIPKSDEHTLVRKISKTRQKFPCQQLSRALYDADGNVCKAFRRVSKVKCPDLNRS